MNLNRQHIDLSKLAWIHKFVKVIKAGKKSSLENVKTSLALFCILSKFGHPLFLKNFAFATGIHKS